MLRVYIPGGDLSASSKVAHSPWSGLTARFGNDSRAHRGTVVTALAHHAREAPGSISGRSKPQDDNSQGKKQPESVAFISVETDPWTFVLACSSLRFFGLMVDRCMCGGSICTFPRPAAYRIPSAVRKMVSVGCVFHARHLFIRRKMFGGSKSIHNS